MRLLVHLVLRLVGVVALCLACAVAWVVVDAHRSIEREVAASADRVARDLNGLYWNAILWRGGLRRETILPRPEWRTLDVARLVAPGVCVTFAPGAAEPRRLCGQEEGVGSEAPAWFAAAYESVFGAHAPAVRPLTLRDRSAGVLTVEAVPAAALRQAWAQLSIVASVAAAMAAGVALLAGLMIGHALKPARAIVDGLRRLEAGERDARLPAFRTAEFDLIARAVNDLSDRLARTAAERAALTKRLFQVQEEERRALARDLHDEFGQCLTAIAALAASIEDGARDRPDLADDAGAIARVQARMMATLKGALARLRSQDVDELGLEGSLEQLVAGWNARAKRPGVFRLSVAGELAAVPAQIAVHLYRIAQECLTNAARHGRPSDVRLTVAWPTGRDAVELSVEDDGGGDPARIATRAGNGLLGIRERVQSLGGSLSIGPARGGVKIAALVPLMGAGSVARAAA